MFASDRSRHFEVVGWSCLLRGWWAGDGVGSARGHNRPLLVIAVVVVVVVVVIVVVCGCRVVCVAGMVW